MYLGLPCAGKNIYGMDLSFPRLLIWQSMRALAQLDENMYTSRVYASGLILSYTILVLIIYKCLFF